MFEQNSVEDAKTRADWMQWKAVLDEEMISLMEDRTWDAEK